MARKWAAVLVLLVFSIGCRRKMRQPTENQAPEVTSLLAKPQPGQQRPTHAMVQEEAVHAGSLQLVLDEQNRVEQQRNATQAAETAKRERMVQEAAYQRRTAANVRVRRMHRHRPRDSSGNALVAHEEIGAHAAVPGVTAHATLQFKNDAGDSFRLVDARFVMDGAALPTIIKAAERGTSYVVFSGDLSVGHHAVTAQLTYQGTNHGVFRYMNGYTFKVRSDEVLMMRGDLGVNFTIICKERTGFNDGVEKRLVVTVEGHHAA
jgi:hypothetical protein